MVLVVPSHSHTVSKPISLSFVDDLLAGATGAHELEVEDFDQADTDAEDENVFPLYLSRVPSRQLGRWQSLHL